MRHHRCNGMTGKETCQRGTAVGRQPNHFGNHQLFSVCGVIAWNTSVEKANGLHLGANKLSLLVLTLLILPGMVQQQFLRMPFDLS